MPKTGIHPQYSAETTVNCICGNTFTIASTDKGPMKVESCPACHPAYNKGLIVKQVTKGRMEKYAEKLKKIDAAKTTTTKVKKTVTKPAKAPKE